MELKHQGCILYSIIIKIFLITLFNEKNSWFDPSRLSSQGYIKNRC